jgi:high-affinity Fe2+/Pb2+ permease
VTDQQSLAEQAQSKTIRWLMLAVLAWGLILALGAYLFGGNKPLLRALIIAGCTLAFLTFWLLALASQRRNA